MNRTVWGGGAVLAMGMALAATVAAGTPAQPMAPVAAVASPAATRAMMLGADWAGQRAVAVGEHGIVLLSDDAGVSLRQARSVPLDATLTAVHFVNARSGWAVGHWGAVIATEDGGDSWRVQRLDVQQDRPLFAVHFFDEREGVAVGLWSLVLRTEDGGKTWSEHALPPAPGARRADLNLLSLFGGTNGVVYATAERGRILRSDDRGRNWRYMDTGYQGSLWTGIELADGSLLVAGQRGTVLRSPDAGAHWERIPLASQSSVTSVVASGPEVLLVGLDGLQVLSVDGGRSFKLEQQPALGSLTTALLSGGQRLVFSRRGVVAPSK